MDANRALNDAIDIGGSGQKYAEQAWMEYHSFIEIAKRRASSTYGKAHFFDIHGNTMSVKTMLGYLLRKTVFDGDLQELIAKLSESSLKTLMLQSNLDNQARLDLLLGTESFAAYMKEEGGFDCTPFGQQPFDWGGPGN